jgi:phosphatidylinositol-3-phosphatase
VGIRRFRVSRFGGALPAVSVGAALAVLVATGCAAPANRPEAGIRSPVATGSTAPAEATVTSSRVAGSVPQLSRVVVIVMENKHYGQVIGSPDAPYENSLAARYGLATSFFAITHPSLPNYLGLLGGSTFDIKTDCLHCKVGNSNLIDQLEPAGISWKAYMSGMPSPCYKGPNTDLYVKRHNPFLYFTDISKVASRCAHVVPLDELDGDISGGTLPAFVWITPDLCQDSHDCPVSSGDAFLSDLVPKLLDAIGPRGAVFLTWDESKARDVSGCCQKASGGHIPTIVAGPLVAAGTSVETPFDQYSILRTIEEGFALPPLRDAGCSCTENMGAFFTAP